MKTKTEIIEALARDRVVETMIKNIAHQQMSADLEDLSQMVYLILLEYDEKKLLDLYENDQMQFFIARIIVNQYRSNNSPFYTIIRKFRSMIEKTITITAGEYSKCETKHLDILDTKYVLQDED